MAHRLSPHAETELDDIWYYIARESGSIDIADRLIDSITVFPCDSRLPVGEYIIIYRTEARTSKWNSSRDKCSTVAGVAIRRFASARSPGTAN